MTMRGRMTNHLDNNPFSSHRKTISVLVIAKEKATMVFCFGFSNLQGEKIKDKGEQHNMLY